MKIPSKLSEEELDERIDDSGLLDRDGVEIELPEILAQYLSQVTKKESPSSLLPFIQCELKWFYGRYVPILSEVADEEEETPWGVAGAVAHRILQVFLDEPAENRTPDLLEQIKEHAWNVLTNQDVEDGFLPEAEILRYARLVDQGNKRFIQIFEEIVDAVDNIYEFENPAEVAIIKSESYVASYVNNVRIAGKIDRVIKSESGSEIIDDYKFGKAPEGDQEIDILTERYLQPAIYGWLRYVSTARHAISPIEVEAFRLLFIAHFQRVRINLNIDSIALVQRTLERLTERIADVSETGVLIARPSRVKRGSQCDYCPVLNVCPARAKKDEDPDLLSIVDVAAIEAVLE